MINKITTFAQKFFTKVKHVMSKYLFIFVSMIVKLQELLQSMWGVCLIVLGFVANFFGGYVMAVSAVVTCVVIDLIWGILSARKQGKYTQSELIKSTVTKLTAYGTALLVFIFVEKLVGLSNLPTGVVASIICATELWSTSGNILIVNPNIPFFKILIPVLRGEIARKLNIPEDYVDEVLSGEHKEK